MTDEVTELLRSADGGRARPDLDDITRRGRRQVATRSLAVVAGIAVGVAGAIGLTSGLVGTGNEPLPLITDVPPDEQAETGEADDGATGDGRHSPGRSQSTEDAQRDGVIDKIAALPFGVRVNPELAVVRPDAQVRAVTDEGVWVVSRPDRDAIDSDGPLVGNTDGLYGRDFVDLIGYGEILLLDTEETEIVRAYPFPDLAPQALAVTDEAVYCTRQGDGGLPDSMLCRIDRRSLQSSARVFPSSDNSQFLDPSQAYMPPSWTVDDPVGEPLFGDLQVSEDELYSIGQTDKIGVDPATLQLLDDDRGPTAVTSQDERLIANFLQLATDPNLNTAEALPFADEVWLGLGSDLHEPRSFDELGDAAAWRIDVDDFRAHVGPFSALDVLTDADEYVVSGGDHDHCAAPPEPAPDAVADLRRISVQPILGPQDGCLQWWTVDLFADDDGRIAAVTAAGTASATTAAGGQGHVSVVIRVGRSRAGSRVQVIAEGRCASLRRGDLSTVPVTDPMSRRTIKGQRGPPWRLRGRTLGVVEAFECFRAVPEVVPCRRIAPTAYRLGGVRHGRG